MVILFFITTLVSLRGNIICYTVDYLQIEASKIGNKKK